MRSQYREVSAAEQAQIAELKHMGENFCNLVDALRHVDDNGAFDHARSRMEEAVFWAVKGVTA